MKVNENFNTYRVFQRYPPSVFQSCSWFSTFSEYNVENVEKAMLNTVLLSLENEFNQNVVLNSAGEWIHEVKNGTMPLNTFEKY